MVCVADCFVEGEERLWRGEKSEGVVAEGGK